MLEGLSDADLQAHALEAYRAGDFRTGSLVAREARARANDPEAGADVRRAAGTILELAESIALPDNDLKARNALSAVRLAALDAESLYRSGSMGKPIDPQERLSMERQKDVIRGREPEPVELTPTKTGP